MAEIRPKGAIDDMEHERQKRFVLPLFVNFWRKI